MGQTGDKEFDAVKKTSISVFVEMILNPDNMVLDRLTPVIFKVFQLYHSYAFKFFFGILEVTSFIHLKFYLFLESACGAET